MAISATMPKMNPRVRRMERHLSPYVSSDLMGLPLPLLRRRSQTDPPTGGLLVAKTSAAQRRGPPAGRARCSPACYLCARSLSDRTGRWAERPLRHPAARRTCRPSDVDFRRRRSDHRAAGPRSTDRLPPLRSPVGVPAHPYGRSGPIAPALTGRAMAWAANPGSPSPCPRCSTTRDGQHRRLVSSGKCAPRPVVSARERRWFTGGALDAGAVTRRVTRNDVEPC